MGETEKKSVVSWEIKTSSVNNGPQCLYCSALSIGGSLKVVLNLHTEALDHCSKTHD